LTEPFQAAQSQRAGDSMDVSLSDTHKSASGEMAFISSNTGSYFEAIPRLNELRAQVLESCGPSAYDLVNMLNRQACQSGFEPIGANTRGITSDDFFKSNAQFMALEEQLAARIVPENVSEVFALIKETSYYKPTLRVVNRIESIYRKLLEQKDG
jgi:hypothetical protein